MQSVLRRAQYGYNTTTPTRKEITKLGKHIMAKQANRFARLLTTAKSKLQANIVASEIKYECTEPTLSIDSNTAGIEETRMESTGIEETHMESTGIEEFNKNMIIEPDDAVANIDEIALQEINQPTEAYTELLEINQSDESYANHDHPESHEDDHESMWDFTIADDIDTAGSTHSINNGDNDANIADDVTIRSETTIDCDNVHVVEVCPSTKLSYFSGWIIDKRGLTPTTRFDIYAMFEKISKQSRPWFKNILSIRPENYSNIIVEAVYEPADGYSNVAAEPMVIFDAWRLDSEKVKEMCYRNYGRSKRLQLFFEKIESLLF